MKNETKKNKKTTVASIIYLFNFTDNPNKLNRCYVKVGTGVSGFNNTTRDTVVGTNY